MLFRLIESIPITGVLPFEIQLRGRKAVVWRLFSGISKGIDDVLCLLALAFSKSSLALDGRDRWFSVGDEGNVDLRECNTAFTVSLQGGGESGLARG